MTGTHLIHKLPEELNLTIPKKERKYKPKAKKAVIVKPIEPIEKKEIIQIKQPGLKERVLKLMKEREEKRKAEEANKSIQKTQFS